MYIEFHIKEFDMYNKRIKYTISSVKNGTKTSYY